MSQFYIFLKTHGDGAFESRAGLTGTVLLIQERMGKIHQNILRVGLVRSVDSFKANSYTEYN